MADNEGTNLDGNQGGGSDDGSGSGVTSELWKELGFDSREALAKEFAKQKTDIAKFKPDARKAGELEAKLTKLQEAEDARIAADMSELEKQTANLAKQKTEMDALQSRFDKSQKDVVYEKAVSARLANYSETERVMIRRLYDTAGNFADEDELKGLLDQIDIEWKAQMDTYGGERPAVGGANRGRSVRDIGPASQDEVVLAHTVAEGGAMALLRKRFGK